MSQRYPKEVHDFIRNNVAGHATQELADLTNAAFGTDFTAASMKSYKANHKLRSGTPCGLPKGRATEMYPAEVAAYIRENYKGTSYADMAAQLKEVFGREYTPAQIMGYYKNHKLNSGLTGHFEKGHVPPNKGRKGYVAPDQKRDGSRRAASPGTPSRSARSSRRRTATCGRRSTTSLACGFRTGSSCTCCYGRKPTARSQRGTG